MNSVMEYFIDFMAKYGIFIIMLFWCAVIVWFVIRLIRGNNRNDNEVAYEQRQLIDNYLYIWMYMESHNMSNADVNIDQLVKELARQNEKIQKIKINTEDVAAKFEGDKLDFDNNDPKTNKELYFNNYKRIRTDSLTGQLIKI